MHVERIRALVEEGATLSFVRSSGPGGQHVNKTSTAVCLSLPLAALESLGPEALALIRQKLGGRISKEDQLVVQVQDGRSQWHNRQAAYERATDMLVRALRRDPPRTATRPTRASKERRLDAKARTGRVKQHRQRPGMD